MLSDAAPEGAAFLLFDRRRKRHGKTQDPDAVQLGAGVGHDGIDRVLGAQLDAVMADLVHPLISIHTL